MQPENRRILYIVLVVIIVVLVITLGLVFGLKKKDDGEEKKTPADDDSDKIDVLNLYNNTEELIQLFPVVYATTVLPGIEKNIQNRLLTGFVNWNRGFKTWKAWGDILYTNESIYNVQGARLTLAHYQAAMDISLKRVDIQMGKFHNMVIVDNYCGIHYDSINNGKTGTVMEFVKFKEYGNETHPDTRVEEGWGGTKKESYYDFIKFQGEDEKAKQNEQDEYNLKYVIPDEEDLKKKYIIKYNTSLIDENADEILNITLKGFDSWNKGISYYLKWVEDFFDENATSSSLEGIQRNKTQYKIEIQELFDKKNITKLYFDNLLIRDNWTALHYRYRSQNLTNKEEVDVGDRMEFFKFEEKEGNYTIVANWVK